ncbi:energy transducer TonB [Thalassotalea euphylliae]|uniref:energy transducer TonB n=1 Tax=Thalassotalea euphylliae TaxID=1655234 RepID=UPI003627674E
MKEDKFDQELTKLYQERKSSVIAPEVELSESDTRKLALSKAARYLLIPIIGGASSFGVFAIITHFASQKPAPQVSQTAHTPVVVIDNQIDTQETKVALKSASLPPIPNSETLPEINLERPENGQAPKASVDIVMDVTSGEQLIFDTLASPRVSYQPTYKVMPNIAKRDKYERVNGTVMLEFDIDEKGNVLNVKVVESDVHNRFNIASRKALRQWRYAEGQASQGNKIAFEFSNN